MYKRNNFSQCNKLLSTLQPQRNVDNHQAALWLFSREMHKLQIVRALFPLVTAQVTIDVRNN